MASAVMLDGCKKDEAANDALSVIAVGADIAARSSVSTISSVTSREASYRRTDVRAAITESAPFAASSFLQPSSITAPAITNVPINNRFMVLLLDGRHEFGFLVIPVQFLERIVRLGLVEQAFAFGILHRFKQPVEHDRSGRAHV